MLGFTLAQPALDAHYYKYGNQAEVATTFYSVSELALTPFAHVHRTRKFLKES